MRARVKSQSAFARAQRLIPGGVNSPVRAFQAVGGNPPFIVRGQGAYIYDLDGNEYIDYMLSWGPLILGHAHPVVVTAVKQAAERGTSFGAPTEAESELAGLVQQRMPQVQKLRLVSSGTEAVMTALRLARAYTGRELILKFDGCYHGHSDGLLVQAGSGLATGGLPGSAGIPTVVTQSTLSLPYNGLPALAAVFREKGDQIAAVIVEPVAANMGVVLPAEGFLNGIRDLTTRHGAVLIFDEVITGFRLARGGATEVFGISPDLVCLGKILGGGMPIGGVGGKREIMDQLAPLGEVYQAGTLSGNPLSTAAGIATLRLLEDAEIYSTLWGRTQQLAAELRNIFTKAGTPICVNFHCGLLTMFFTEQPISNFETARNCNQTAFIKFFNAMLERGIYLPPSPFEAWFLATEHTDELLEKTLKTIQRSLT